MLGNKANSHLVAALVTIFIEAIIIFFLTVDLKKGGGGSADIALPSNESLTELELLLEQDFLTEVKALNHTIIGEGESISEPSEVQAKSKSANEKPLELKNDTAIVIVKSDTTTIIDTQLAALIDSIKTTDPDTTSIKQGSEAGKAGISANKAANTKRLTEQERLDYYRNNYRLIRNFRVVYPYALKTRDIVSELNQKLTTISNQQEKKKLIKTYEDMLFAEYEQAVRKMTVSQGKLLLKLIARETNKTGYELIREFKGNFSASFWYGVGRIFGTNLKETYDQKNDDKLIEEVLEKHNSNEL